VDYLGPDGQLAEDELFYAQQNAMTVRNAEAYYRTMFRGRVTSWNMRDKHMAQTLNALVTHLDSHGGAEPARIVVWAHNSHVGDARATEVSADGQLTIGQLAREHYGEACRLIGFSTHRGTVTAASDWGGIAERKVVRPALNGQHRGTAARHRQDVVPGCPCTTAPRGEGARGGAARARGSE